MAEIGSSFEGEPQVIERIEGKEALDGWIGSCSLRCCYIKSTAYAYACLKTPVPVCDAEEKIDGIGKVLMGGPFLIGFKAEPKDKGRCCSFDTLEV